MSDRIKLESLPERNDPDYFRILVHNCIETFKELPSDELCLNYNKVLGKLRVMVLDDEEYKQETRNIYAKQKLEELQELGELMRSSPADEDIPDEDDQEASDPRNRKRLKKKSPGGMDKETIAMRLKAVQLRRELIASLNEESNTSERDSTNFLHVAVMREEIEKAAAHEIYDGNSDADLEELTNDKEDAPTGSGDKMRTRGQSRPMTDEDYFETLPNGEIVEK
jgi:hypothetical protein